VVSTFKLESSTDAPLANKALMVKSISHACFISFHLYKQFHSKFPPRSSINWPSYSKTFNGPSFLWKMSFFSGPLSVELTTGLKQLERMVESSQGQSRSIKFIVSFSSMCDWCDNDFLLNISDYLLEDSRFNSIQMQFMFYVWESTKKEKFSPLKSSTKICW
jgi:hypothetical protein